MTDDDIAWCKSQARLLVRGGFHSREDTIAMVQDCIEGDGLDIELSAASLVDAEISSLQEEQVSWEHKTDFDRLEDAFRILKSKGIVARHDFTCCGTCGTAEIIYEAEDEQKFGATMHGYVFYHQQDTESAVEGYGLYFNYGALAETANDAQHIEIGNLLAKTLSSVGLNVDWNGTLEERVGVALDWKRPWGSTSVFVQA